MCMYQPFLCIFVSMYVSLWASLVAQIVKNLLAVQETWVQPLGWEDPMEKGMATHSVFLPGEFYGQRSLASYSPWGCKESDTTEQLTGTYTHISSYRLARYHLSI